MIYTPHPMPAADSRTHSRPPSQPVRDPQRNADDAPPRSPDDAPDRKPYPPDSIPNPMPGLDPQQTPGIDRWQDDAFEAAWRRATREL